MKSNKESFFSKSELAVVQRIISLENDIYKTEPKDSRDGNIPTSLRYMDEPLPQNIQSLNSLMHEQSFEFLNKLCAFMYFGRDDFEHESYTLDESYRYVREDLKMESKEELENYMLEKGPKHLSDYLTRALERYYD